LGLFIDNASNATLKDDVQMPKRIADVVKRYRTAHERADREQEQEHASATARRAVNALARGRLRLSRRHAAEGLGISAQRVQQLLETGRLIEGGRYTAELPPRRPAFSLFHVSLRVFRLFLQVSRWDRFGHF
jgi:hypothetical protein